MSKLSFILYPDPRLRLAAAPRALDAALIAVGSALLEAAEAHRVYGLAAAHIGAVEPVIVVSVAPPESRDYRILYNPRVIDRGGDIVAGAEGSVSLPGIEVDIARPHTATIGFDDAEGLAQTLALEGFAARVALHEIEQMNGVFFLAHLSRLKRDSAIRRFQKLTREPN